MDANTLTAILSQLQQSNQEFIRSMLEQKSIKQTFISSFKYFDKSKETWATYLLQLEQHFIANNVIEDDTKRACLLSWIGGESLDLLKKFYGDKVAQEQFNNLIKKLTEHFEKKPHMLASRFKFYRTFMQPNQTYSEWIAELRGRAKECNFICERNDCGESYEDSKIRDMLILYTPHDRVRSTALQKENPTLDEVLQIAQLYEETTKTCIELKGENQKNVEEVNATYRQTRRAGAISKSRGGSTTGGRESIKSCPGCGVNHQRSQCFHYKNKSLCRKCKKTGHISAVCLSSKTEANQYPRSSQSPIQKHDGHRNNNNENVNSIKQFETVSAVDVLDASVLNTKIICGNVTSEKLFVDVSVNGEILQFQVDTGASCSLIGLEGYHRLNKPPCKPTTKILKAYGGVILPLKGIISVNVAFSSRNENLTLMVVNSTDATNILGMDWFKKMEFAIHIPKCIERATAHCSEISHYLKKDKLSLKLALNLITEKFKSTFSSELGHCSTYRADIVLRPDARPKFYKPYNLPFALYDDVRTEINRLVSQKILKPVNASDWAAPIVVIKKPNGKIRICADFKVTVNPQIEIDRYPIPRIEELFHRLSGGQLFTKIDLSDAYLQIELTESAKRIMVINTPFGLYQYERMPFGIASAPGIFQKIMEGIVADIPGCAVYLDDVIITGKNNEEHRNNVKAVLERLFAHNLTCRKEKCHFAEETVEYVGHEIDARGIRPSEKRIEAIKLMPAPKNIMELESFIGKINYYHKFIPNFATKASALNQLRRQNKDFVWESDQNSAFQSLKNDIIRAVQLVHFDEKLPLILATDASQTGIGAALSHRYPDGAEQPISFASKTLNVSQTKYSQIEREALSIIFGVTRYHQYLYGRKFELLTDNQALVTLLHPSKKLPVMTLHRLQRWAIILQSYTYSIRYRNTKQHANADALSRLPMGDDVEFDNKEKEMLSAEQIYESIVAEFPISSEVIAAHTKEDKALSLICHYVKNGWPKSLPKSQVNLTPYFNRKLALTVQNGVLLLQTDHIRVVIPKVLEERVLQMLHEGHWGQTRMQQLARRYIWFPNLDQAIKSTSEACTTCCLHASNPKQEFSPWPEATQPWERIHIDFAGPFFSRMWLLVVDSFSGFPFVFELSSTTSTSTIYALQKIFAIEGLPKTIVSDNGPQFSSFEFQQFCKLNSIDHVKSAPFHPASNGLAERAVRTFKEGFKKIMHEEGDREKALYKYLITFRATPKQTSNKSPAELLHGRQPRTIFSAMFPDVHQAQHHATKFGIGTRVYARSYTRGNRWIAGRIAKILGRVTYIVQISGGNIKRHQNQLRSRKDKEPTNEATDDVDIYWKIAPSEEGIARECTSNNDTDMAVEPPNQSSKPSPELPATDIQGTEAMIAPTPRRTERKRIPRKLFQAR